MRNFKSFITELSQVIHTNIFNALAGKLQLTHDHAKKLFPLAGKKGEFKHITDEEGAVFLIKNKDKDISISVEKFGKMYRGIETKGTHLLMVDGEYITWAPNDATTSIGEGGIRWQGISRETEPFPPAFKAEYFKGLVKIIKNDPIYPTLENMTSATGVPITSFLELNSFKNWNDSFTSDDPGSNPHEKELEKQIEEYKKTNSADLKSLYNRIMAHQNKMINKHSADITQMLSDEWLQKQHKPFGRGIRYDEAVIDHVVVKQVILTHEHIQSAFLDAIGNVARGQVPRLPFYDTLKKYITNLKKAGWKGPLTIMGYRHDFKDLKSVMSDKEKSQATKKVLDDLGLKHVKGIWFKIK